MKEYSRYIIQTLRAKLGNRRPDDKQAHETDLEQEISVGAVIGCSACVVMAWGTPPLVISMAAMIGLFTGAGIGLALWSASATLPEQRIVPPAPGMKRSPPAGRWRQPCCKGSVPNGRGSVDAPGRPKSLSYINGGSDMTARSKFRRAGAARGAHKKAAVEPGRPIERGREANPPAVAEGLEVKGSRELIEQAARDISRGLRDTDQHGIPSNVPGPGVDPEHSPGAEVPPEGVDASGRSNPHKSGKR